MDKYTTKSFQETQQAGAELARKLTQKKTQKTATVLALRGDLGAGKTTFLQGFAKGLGVKENILSPTFVIMKKFLIPRNAKLYNSQYSYFYHFDCYRLNSYEEVLQLGFKEVISDPKNIVAIEWPEKLGEALLKNTITIKFEHLSENERELTILV